MQNTTLNNSQTKYIINIKLGPESLPSWKTSYKLGILQQRVVQTQSLRLKIQEISRSLMIPALIP